MSDRLRHTAIASMMAALLAACGGSSDAPAPEAAAPAPAPAPALAPVAVRVIDGAIRNALVCLDVNGNGACDGSEPSGRTDANGDVTLQVDPALAGKHPIVAVVGTDAVDADHGAVTTPFVMKAPADQPAVVSPLTTLVQTTAESTGLGTNEAAASVRNQLGINVSLFQDFTSGTAAESAVLGAVARMVVVTQQQQTTALAGAVGSTAIDGSTITQADIDALVTRRLLEILPALATAVSDPSVQTAIAARDPAAINTALQPLAQNIVQSPETGLQPESAATLVAVNRQAATPPAAESPTSGVTLANLFFNNAQNWFRRVFTSTTAQATPDSQGLTRNVEQRSRSTSGVVANWGYGADPFRQSDWHWNGSSWVQCGLGHLNTGSVRDAQGRSTYDYCDRQETGTQTRAVFDVAGQPMAQVYQRARDAGFTNLTINGHTTALGSAVFPANSRVSYQTNVPLTTAPTYQALSSTIVRVYSTPQLVAGEAAACSGLTTMTDIGEYTVEPSTLEQVVAAVRGTPCAYQARTITGAGGVSLTSGPRNEAWGFPSLSVGTLGTATIAGSIPASTSYFSANQLLRVAFGDGNRTTYYSCREQNFDGAARNCDAIGTGTYTIGTLGDARVLSLQGQPVQFAGLTYERVFVERGGKVYLGSQSRLNPNKSVRLNTEAAQALLTQLGVPTVAADSTIALTPASYQGDWIFWGAAEGPDGYLGETTIVRFPQTFNGSAGAQCFDSRTGRPVGTAFPCTVTLDAAGNMSFTDNRDASSATAKLDFVAGTATGTADGQTIHGRRR